MKLWDKTAWALLALTIACAGLAGVLWAIAILAAMGRIHLR